MIGSSRYVCDVAKGEEGEGGRGEGKERRGRGEEREKGGRGEDGGKYMHM